MKVVMIATLTVAQLEYVKKLATENGIAVEYVVETEEVAQIATSTPLTGAMLEEIATQTGKTVLEVATLANSMGILTVQDALSHSEVPSSVKELLENYL